MSLYGKWLIIIIWEKICKIMVFSCRTFRTVILLKVIYYNYLGKICKITVFSCRTFRIVHLLKVIDHNYLGKTCKITVFSCRTFMTVPLQNMIDHNLWEKPVKYQYFPAKLLGLCLYWRWLIIIICSWQSLTIFFRAFFLQCNSSNSRLLSPTVRMKTYKNLCTDFCA